MEVLKSEILEAINGSYSTIQQYVFINNDSLDFDNDNLSDKDMKLYFHEKYHHWQSLFTCYGQHKWGAYRTVFADVIGMWIEGIKLMPNPKLLPYSSMINYKTDISLKAVIQIHMQLKIVQMLGLNEYSQGKSEIIELLKIDGEELIPKVVVSEEEHVLNGIDVIESFTKYQEAIFGFVYYDIPFEKTMNFHELKKEYYFAFYYYLYKLKGDRHLEFPIVCEIALSAGSFIMPSDREKWHKNHIAWRFIKIIEVLENNQDMIRISLDNVTEKYSEYVNTIINKCNFDDIGAVDDGIISYLRKTGELNMCNERIKALEFKKKYPWAFAYPFINEDIFKSINKFQPLFYNYHNTTHYSENLENSFFIDEVVFENHLQAFASQILGLSSLYRLYPDDIMCGFSYYGLKGCPFQLSNECNGSLNPQYGLEVPFIIDEDSNIASGCSFGFFLSFYGIEISNLIISKDKIDFSFEKLKDIATSRKV